MDNSQRELILQRVREIVLSFLQDRKAKVYLFGSWARGQEKRTSDIDVAIWYEEVLPLGLLAQLSSVLEESTVPYRVDIVDLTKAGKVLIRKVEKEGIVWKD